MKLDNLKLFEAMDPTKVEELLSANISEWKELKKNLLLIEQIASVIKGRVEEVESQMSNVMNVAETTKETVDGAIVTLTTRRGSSVKYKEAFEKAKGKGCSCESCHS